MHWATKFPQGCALRAVGCLRGLTLAFGRADNLTFFHMLGTLDFKVWNFGSSVIFLRTQPCNPSLIVVCSLLVVSQGLGCKVLGDIRGPARGRGFRCHISKYQNVLCWHFVIASCSCWKLSKIHLMLLHLRTVLHGIHNCTVSQIQCCELICGFVNFKAQN